MAARFPVGLLSSVQKQGVLSESRRLLDSLDVIAADESIYADAAAPLLELASPEALKEFLPLCQEAMYVKPALVLVRTLASLEVWDSRMDRAYQEDAARAALRLRWRQSYRGGRTIAQPAATGRQLQAARRAVNAPGPTPADHSITISVPSGTAAVPDEILEAVQQLLKNQGLLLQRAADSAPPRPGTWQPVKSTTGGGNTGSMMLHLGSQPEVDKVRNLIHDRAFQAGSDLVSMSVHTADFRARGSRRRAGPPGIPHSA